MREKKVKRFYCDHCNKGGFSRASMERHENTCFKNLKRDCWVCKEFGLSSEHTLDEIKKTMREEGFEAASRMTECPACLVAAVIHCNAYYIKTGEYDYCIDYPYKEAMQDLRQGQYSAPTMYL